MKKSDKIALFIIFIVFILIFSTYLILSILNRTETFENNPTTTTTTSSQPEAKDIETSTINDTMKLLDKYKILDIPIIANNMGMCDQWSTYNPGKSKSVNYDIYGNKCVAINTTTPNAYYCVDQYTHEIVTCSNLVTQDVIDNLNIDINALINDTQLIAKLNDDIAKYLSTYAKLDSDLFKILDDITAIGTISNEQAYFIKNNDRNNSTKQDLVQKYQTIYETDTNNISMSVDKINDMKTQNLLYDSRQKIYKYVIYALVAILTILIIIKFISTPNI